MTEKIQKIKEEIERRIEETESMQPKFDQFWAGQISAFKGVMEIIDSLPEEPVSEDLEEAAEKYAYDEFPSIGIPNTVIELSFKAGAEWQLNQMKEILRTEYEKGRFDLREEMMKYVVEGKVQCGWGDGNKLSIKAMLPQGSDLKNADKVKIVVLKTE